MKKFYWLLLIVALSVSACKCPDMKIYVEADEGTYNALSGEYVIMIDGSDLTKEEKDRRKLLIMSWKQRIDNTKKTLEE